MQLHIVYPTADASGGDSAAMPDRLSIPGGRIRERASDFVVEELWADLPDTGDPQNGMSDYSYLWIYIEKSHITSDACMDVIARALSVDRTECAYSGRKDKAALTRQWFSAPMVPNARSLLTRAIEELGAVDESDKSVSAQLLDVRPAHDPVRMGRHEANRFDIWVRGLGVEKAEAERIFHEQQKRILRYGVANAFGPQRFGHEGSTLALGERLLGGERLRMARRKRQFAYNAVQSALFNAYLNMRVQRFGLLKVLPGDVLYNSRTGVQRWALQNEDAASLALQGETVAGPLFGPRMRRAKGEVLALEKEVLDAADTPLSTFEAGDCARLAPGGRRALRLDVNDLSLKVEGEQAESCDVRCSFTLRSGAFATVVLQQVLGLEVPPG